MHADELIHHIEAHFSHVPTAEQQQALRLFANFLTDTDPRTAMILRGSAGTGKTTLAAAIVRALLALRQKLVLMAPTGRAAKVFANYSGHNAYTIHRRIYRQKTAATMSPFSLNANLATDTLFIVDEASMISTQGASDTFGSGNLLHDLISYVYSGQGCRLMLIGDKAQLPPVGETESPALRADVLSSYGLNVCQAELAEVLRQSQQSGILWNATHLWDDEQALPKMRLQPFADIRSLPGDELIEQLASSYSHAGLDDTIVITRSNKRANIYNQGIRRTILDREDELCRGDQLMIVKNNYHWTQQDKLTAQAIPFLANGDRCLVQRVRNKRQMHGFTFADVTLTFPDYQQHELSATLLLDTLTTDAPALTHEQQQQLYDSVMADYADIPLKAERIRQMRQDPFYNALQVKFGYAVTCHKAQGGQWEHVYIDQGYMAPDTALNDYRRWLYTAMTRATSQLYLVNWPTEQTIAGE